MLVAIDDSPNADSAAKIATSLAANYQAELIVLSVVPCPSLFVPTRIGHAPPPVNYKEYYDSAEKKAWKWIDQTVLFARDRGVKKARGRVLRSTGSIVGTIVQNAESEGVDLIVTGTRGAGGFNRMLMGSVSKGVIAHAHCSVLVVR